MRETIIINDLELDTFVPVPMSEEFAHWAVWFMQSYGLKDISAGDVYGMFQAVGMVLMAGGGQGCPPAEAYEHAYLAYCRALEAHSRSRGLDKHPHRHLRPANDA